MHYRACPDVGLLAVLVDVRLDVGFVWRTFLKAGLSPVEGIVAIDAKLFSDVVRKLPDNEVTIETDDKYITTIICEKLKFNIIGKSGDDFSYLPNIEKNEYVSLSTHL